jgi:hypothetical protein
MALSTRILKRVYLHDYDYYTLMDALYAGAPKKVPPENLEIPSLEKPTIRGIEDWVKEAWSRELGLQPPKSVEAWPLLVYEMDLRTTKKFMMLK